MEERTVCGSILIKVGRCDKRCQEWKNSNKPSEKNHVHALISDSGYEKP